MASLWFNNAKWFRKQKPNFIKSFYSTAEKSFMRYRDLGLRSRFGDSFVDGLSDEEKKEIFFNKIWRGRSVRHFDYKVKDNAIFLTHTDKTLPKLPFRKWFEKGKLRKDVQDAIQIKTSQTCRLIGVTPFALGGQPQKITRVDKNFFNFLEVSNTSKEIYDPVMHDVVTVTGSWGSQITDFQKLCDPIEHDVEYPDYLKAVDNCYDKLLLPMLDPPSVEDLLSVKTNPNSGTGLISTRMFGAKHKKADRYAVRLAQSMYKATGKSPSCDISCWSIGGRNRKQKLNKDGPLRSRIILMPEAPNKILALSYAQRIYNAFGMLNWRNYLREIRIGNNDFHGNYYWYDEYMNKPNTKFLEFDISAHDARTAEITMVVAFGLLRAMFPESETIDNHFLFFMSGTIYKNVATPGRFIFKCLKGIPSGSPFTSMLVSLVNWLNCTSFIQKHLLARSGDYVLHVFGDDTLIRFDQESIYKDPRCVNTQFWEESFKKWCGHTLDPIHVRLWGTNIADESPTFLKTYSWYGLPSRSAKDTMLSSTTIRSSNRSLTRYSNVVKGLCYAAPFDPLSYMFLEEFRTWLLKRRTFIGIQHNDLSPPNDDLQIQKMLRITYTGVTKQYLYPLVFGFDIIKNVDLGNKPSEYVKVGTYNGQWVDYLVEQKLFFRNSVATDVTTVTQSGNDYVLHSLFLLLIFIISIFSLVYTLNIL